MRISPALLLLAVILAASGAVVGAAAAQCPAPGSIVINELAYAPTDGAFIELKGEPGTSLGCLKLISYNGGSAGDQCAPADVFAFEASHMIGESGYFVLATTAGDGVDVVTTKANLQNGPDGLALFDAENEETIDSLVYAGTIGSCATTVQEGANPAPSHPDGASLGRAPDGVDTDDNGADFVVCPSPTPGAVNNCPLPVVCGEQPPAGVAINEVRIRPSANEFVEVAGLPDDAAALGCFALRGIEGGTTSEPVCTVKRVSPFSSVAWPEPIPAIATVPLDIESTGLFGVQVVWLASSGAVVVLDSVKWGGDFAACAEADADLQDLVTAPLLDSTSDTYSNAYCEEESGFQLANSTPGAVNDCTPIDSGEGGGGELPSCPGSPADLRITEIQTGPAAGAFFEIKGPAGEPLDCYAVVAYNGKDGSACEEYDRVTLTDSQVGDDGYFVVAKADGDVADIADLLDGIGDLQNGPDALAVVFYGEGGQVVVDSVVYGAKLAACDALGVGQGAAAKAPANGVSLFRCSEDESGFGDNALDFQTCDVPSPGAASTCQCTICGGVPAEVPRINELQTSVGNDAFVEIYGPAGADLSCFQLVAYNGGAAGDKCDQDKTIELTGGAIGDDGYFVLAPAGGSREADADMTYSGTLQSGPDALVLYYVPTSGDRLQIDSVVYKDALPACVEAGIGTEGISAPEPKRDRSITRCESNPNGVDTNNDGADWTGCSKPTPGAPTECTCDGSGAPSPPGGGGVDSGGGCRAADAHRTLPWAFGLLLLGIGALRRRRLP